MVDSEYFSEFFRKVWAVYTIGVALHGESINTVPSASVLQWKERKKTQCIKAACSDVSLSHKAVIKGSPNSVSFQGKKYNTSK